MTQNRVFLTLFLLVLFTLADSVAVCADDSVAKNAKFVDLDGDGIDDNARDMDEDGIPDLFGNASQAEEKAPEVQYLASFDVGSGMLEAGSNDTKSSKSASFAARKFSTRPLASDRGGIESGDGFGSGSTAGVSTTRGPVCVGGVCRW